MSAKQILPLSPDAKVLSSGWPYERLPFLDEEDPKEGMTRRKKGGCMDSFGGDIALLLVFSVIVYGYKLFLDYIQTRPHFYHTDMNVYKAANAFARGAPMEEVKALLENGSHINVEEVESILTMALSQRADSGWKYQTFIRSVNMVLGGNVYDERHRDQ